MLRKLLPLTGREVNVVTSYQKLCVRPLFFPHSRYPWLRTSALKLLGDIENMPFCHRMAYAD